MSAVKLAFGKFKTFLEKHGYSLSSVYCESESQIKFAECRTPQKQKTFMVCIPSKYSLIATDPQIKTLYINAPEENLNSRQIRYLADLKGILDCDLIAISGSELCWYKNPDNVILYELGDSESKEEVESDEPEPEEEVEGDVVSTLEKETIKITKRIDPTLKKPKIKTEKKPEPEESEEPELEESEEPQPEESKPKEPQPEESEESGPIELIFEDEEGEPIDDVTEFIESEIPEESEEEELIQSEDVPDHVTRSNDHPNNIEYSDIVLGMVYPAIELGVFFRKAKGYEKDVIVACEQIDENIQGIRKTKLKEIKDLCQAFLEHAEKRINEINEEEKNLKNSLIRLTVIQIQTEALKKTVESNPNLENEISEVEKIQEQTKQSIHELNLDFLRLQDSTDELLSNYQSSIKELMEL